MSYFDGPNIQNQMIIIFGATGDLMKQKLLPALYQLYERGYLSQTMPILCIGRKKLTKNSYIDLMEPEKNIPDVNDKLLSGFLQLLHYTRHDIDSNDTASLESAVSRLDKNNNCRGNKLIYLAIPPELFEKATGNIKKSRILAGRGKIKIAYEKPFGYDLKTAKDLNECITKMFREDQIYRIDHYLAKELVQNIIVFRFANSILKDVWDNRYIDNVQITISEKKGIDDRGEYYEKTGVIRDILQNHLMQVLALTAMEEPKKIDADSIRDEKVKVIRALQKVTAKDIVVGQYGPGKVDGNNVVGYRKEEEVAKDSIAETFVAAKIRINNKRWKNVPFYVRTGKRMEKRYSEVCIVLKDVSYKLFEKAKVSQDVIKIKIQPDAGLSITINGKEPGASMKVLPIELDFCHRCRFDINTPGAYEMLLQQIMVGDQTLFPRWDEVQASWKFIDPLIAAARRKKVRFPNYAAGKDGPKDAETLLKRDKREWIAKSKSHVSHKG